MSGTEPRNRDNPSGLETAVTIPPQPRPDAAHSVEREQAQLTEVTIVEASASREKPRAVTQMTMLQEEPPESVPPRSGAGDEMEPGDAIDRYAVVKKLGQGGMGSVYLIRHETLGVFRAAKILAADLYGKGGEFTKRFVQEAQMACAISNPNIVNVLDVCDDTERHFCYIVMEYVDGGTLRDLLRSIPRLNEVHAIAIAGAVAEALQAAAAQNIVHRDIKPDNIMFTRRGEIKLADLGIARSCDDNVQLTRTHAMMGTPAYLAPEQAQDAHSVDARADIYSLGATLYEMLTGQIPYPGKNTYDILTKLSSDPVPDPRSVIDSISGATARLVMKMLAKQPWARHQSAAELLRDIRSLNVLPPEFDVSQSIRELLEQSGAGEYSSVSLTPTTGSTASTRLIRSALLKAEHILRRIPGADRLRVAINRHRVVFYAAIAFVTLLLIGIPLTRLLAARAPLEDYSVETAPPVAVIPVEAASAGAGEKPPAQNLKDNSSSVPGPSVGPNPPPPPDEQRQVEIQAAEQRVTEQQAEAQAAEQRVTAQAPPAATTTTQFVEITPIGAEAIMMEPDGKEVDRQRVPVTGKIEFNVPDGEYLLRVTAAGYRTVERKLAITQTQTISCIKIELPLATTSVSMRFYGNPKLLEFLAQDGMEMQIDNGEWIKIKRFPHEIDLPRTAHTVSVRGKGIFPVARQALQLEPDQEKSIAEFYLTEKEAVLHIASETNGPISINLQGHWEPLRENIPLKPFREYNLQWRDDEGRSGSVAIPALLPESIHPIVIASNTGIDMPGSAEYAEAERLLRAEDYKDAIAKLKQAESLGHPEAAYQLGILDETGKGRWFSSDADARSWYQKAAAPPVNNPRAQYKMGVFCENGRGGAEQSLTQALEWFRKAAAQKNPDALYRMGMAVKNGETEGPVNYVLMAEYFDAAANLNQPDAQYQLGYCLENGIGVPLNVRKAKYWYDKSAAQGNREAQRRGKALESLK